MYREKLYCWVKKDDSLHSSKQSLVSESSIGSGSHFERVHEFRLCVTVFHKGMGSMWLEV